jgi:hypothetical protein
VIGSEALTVIDRQAAERNVQDRKNIRIHLLSGGDQINGANGAVQPAPGKRLLGINPHDTGAVIRFPQMWDRHVVREMVFSLAANPARPMLSDDGHFEYRMTADEATQFYVADDPTPGMTAISVRLDITADRDIEKK